MPVSVEELAEGKCYVTSTDQVRHILEIVETGTDENRGLKVVYESRGGHALPPGKPWNPKVSVGAEQFAAAVDREVRSSWDVRYPEQPV